MFVFQNNTDQDIILSYHTQDNTAYVSSRNEDDSYELVLPAGQEIASAVHCEYLTPVEDSIYPIGTW